MNEEKQLMAHTREQNYGDHGAFVLTTFKPNGDVNMIYRPIAYARIWVYGHALFLEGADGVQVEEVLGHNAQAVLNAIGERKECKFYYGD